MFALQIRRYGSFALATLFGGLYSLGFHAIIENLIGASEGYGFLSALMFLLLTQCALLGPMLSIRKFTPWLSGSTSAKITVFVAAAFSASYYGIVGGFMAGALGGIGSMLFAAPSMLAFLVGNATEIVDPVVRDALRRRPNNRELANGD